MPDALDRFPSGSPKVTLPERLRPQEGRTLCIYGDAGWGDEVAPVKYKSFQFSPLLVKASADLIRVKWKPDPFPEWVTAVPSQRHSELVRDFAQRLAAELGLPFAAVLQRDRSTRPQKEM